MVAIEKWLIFRATFMFLKWKFREFLWNQIFSFLEVSLICYNIVTSCLLPSNYSVSPGLPAARPRGGYGSSILTSILCLMHIIWLLDIGSPHWNWDICLKNLCWWAVLLTNHLSHSGKGAFSEYCVFIPTQHQCQNWGTLVVFVLILSFCLLSLWVRCPAPRPPRPTRD